MAKTLRFVAYYLRLNLEAALEYRAAFIAQALGMFANDAVFAVFWWLYFNRFSDVGGWQAADVALVYAVAAVSIGLATGVFGNCNRVATIIVQGQLDYYLGLPRDTLLHMLVSRSGLAGWGDVCFGLLAYALFGRLEPGPILLYVILVLLSTLMYLSFVVIAGSLAFWIGSAEAAAFQAQQALITFSLYPGAMFQGWIRVLLFTAIPAGFISHVPVQLLRTFDVTLFTVFVAAAALSAILAVAVFRLGLRQYESGNLVVLRG